MNASIILLLIRLGFGIIGVIFIGIAIGVSASGRKKRRVCTQLVRGHIVDVERSDNISMDGLRTVSWYPVYEYEANGHTIRKRSHMGSAHQDFYVGQKVNLYINPENCNEFYCPDEKTGLLVKIFGGIGILLFVLSFMVGFIFKAIM